jgi:peptidoglycan/LPS O-acetylase OafA/YrhL
LVVYWLVWPPAEFVWFEAALATLVAACAVGQNQWLPRALSHPALCHVGQVSYGMYLFHVPVIGVIRALLPSIASHAGLVFPLALAVSIYLATLSHRHFEAWFLSLRGDRNRREPASRNPSRLGSWYCG